MNGEVEAAPVQTEGGMIHPWSAILLVLVDNLWTLAGWAVMLWLITIPLSFLAVFLPAFLIQRYMNGDSTGGALSVASLLGVLAAIPTPITGTTAGALFLSQAGLRFLRSKS